MTPALELIRLSKDFRLPRSSFFAPPRSVSAVRDVSLSLAPNSILGLVGESGSGKTTIGMLALRLTEPSAGRILLGGEDITNLTPLALRPYRRRMQVVFQDSYSALDPMKTLVRTVAEPLHIHGIGTPAEQEEQALHWLSRVGLDPRYGRRYPHELSGGQRQRVAIARALILGPSVLIADEPTSALDVSVKAQVINLLQDLQSEMGLAILFISHDLSVVRSLCDRVAVMWNGRIVEEAQTETIFTGCRHPYTSSLLDAVPVLDPRARRTRSFADRSTLESAIPRLSASDHGVDPTDHPILTSVGQDHRVEAILT